MEVAELKMLRFLSGVTRLDKIRNESSGTTCYLSSSSSSSSRSHLVVGSLRQTQFSSSQFCHGPRLLSLRWLSCLG